MRLTTKITIGIILSIFFISFTFIIGFSFTDRKNYIGGPVADVIIPQDNKTEMDVGPYQVIVLDKDQAGSKTNYYCLSGKCSLSIHSITTESGKNKLIIPEGLSDFIVVNTSDDTLTIKVKFDELCEKYRTGNKKYAVVSGVNLNLHTSSVNVINKLSGIPTEIRNIETGSIRVKAEDHVFIYACNVDIITLLKAGSLKIEECKIKELNLDLDHLRSWKVENCEVGVENLTGGGYHRIQQPKEEAQTVNWQPKNKDARLNVILYGDTSQIVFP